MSCLAVGDTIKAVTKGLDVDLFDGSQHTLLNISPKTKQDGDTIVDIIISPDNTHLAVITALSKELLVYELPAASPPKSFSLPRSASKIRFSPDNAHVLVADKSGDALSYAINTENEGIKIFGHLSLLLDILQTVDNKYIITTDRDEKIKVSCFPNTYHIQAYCLGHKEFVNHIELLSHDQRYVLSTSGDGTIKLWNPVDGKACYSIDTKEDITDDQLRTDFIKAMDEEGIQVNTLPIVHLAVAQLSPTSSILAVTVHNFNGVLFYILNTVNGQPKHKLLERLHLKRFPDAIAFHKTSLHVYDEMESLVKLFNIGESGSQHGSDIKVFVDSNVEVKSNVYESIKVLYKRKFDNVQEYQERKKQRLGRTQ